MVLCVFSCEFMDVFEFGIAKNVHSDAVLDSLIFWNDNNACVTDESFVLKNAFDTIFCQILIWHTSSKN